MWRPLHAAVWAICTGNVETSPDGIWVIGLDGATVYANPEIARIHGVAESALATLTVFDTLDDIGREPVVEVGRFWRSTRH